MPSHFHSGAYKTVPFHGYGLALLTSHLPACAEPVSEDKI